MKKYNRVEGVPKGSYYLLEITVFGDFECPQEERILFTSDNRQELVDLCFKNNWACPDCKNDASGWYTHFIERRA